jgi:hypothetical protein
VSVAELLVFQSELVDGADDRRARETRCTSFRLHDRAYPNATPRRRTADRRFAAQFLLTCCSQPVISAAEVGGPGCIYGMSVGDAAVNGVRVGMRFW